MTSNQKVGGSNPSTTPKKMAHNIVTSDFNQKNTILTFPLFLFLNLKNFIMSLSEAQELLNQSKKVRHRFFTDNEWMKKISSTYYEFEDGVICLISEFWKYRQDESFKIDWYEVQD